MSCINNSEKAFAQAVPRQSQKETEKAIKDLTIKRENRGKIPISCNLTNNGLLTIGRHYTLTGSSAFLHFGAYKVQDIGTANTEMHHESKKALVYQGL